MVFFHIKACVFNVSEYMNDLVEEMMKACQTPSPERLTVCQSEEARQIGGHPQAHQLALSHATGMVVDHHQPDYQAISRHAE